MRNHDFNKSFLAEGAIAAHRLVKFGTADDAIVQAAAGADLTIGVNDLAVAQGEVATVVMGGVAIVEYGGNVTRGALLTANASGQAVTAATTNRVIGVAMVSGVAGDLGSVLLAPSTAP